MDKKFEARLRKALQITPRVDAEHLAETQSKARAALTSTQTVRPIGLVSFMFRQVRLRGFNVWLWQGFCLVLQCLWLGWYFRGNGAAGSFAQLEFALCVFGGMFVLSGMPYLERSWTYRMQEVELTCFYSLPRLILARLLVVGLGGVFCLGALVLLMASLSMGTDNALAMSIGFLIFSYLLAALGCVFIADRLRGRGATLFCYIWTILVSVGLFLLWTNAPALLMFWVLPVLCVFALALLVWQTAVMLRRTRTLDTAPI